MHLLELRGSPAAMGEAFGESCREAIATLYACRLENALRQAERYGGRTAHESDLLALAGRCRAIARDWDPAGAAELEGIARGSGLSADRVLAMNGLTDLRDALAWGGPLEAAGGCTAVIVQRDRARDGRLRAAQTWDLSTDNMPFVVAVRRRPTDGPETLGVTTVGCLSLLGVNEHGLALGTTNLRTRDARPGVPYLSVIHRALACRATDEAVETIRRAPRAGGHFYSVVDGRGRAAAVECTATLARVTCVDSGVHVQTNHCRASECARLEGDVPYASSHARLGRMQELLGEDARHDGASLERALADRANAELAICRDDFDGISTNAAWVVCPEDLSVRACHGPPDRSPWVDLAIGPDPGAG